MGRRKKTDDEVLDHDEHEETQEELHEGETHEDGKKRKRTSLSEQVMFPIGRTFNEDCSIVDANGHCHRAFHHYEPGGDSERITAHKDFARLLDGSKKKKALASFARRYAEYETQHKPFRDSKNRYAFAIVADGGQINLVVSCNHAFPGLAGKKVLSILKDLGL